MVATADGSDTGGSLRNPAAWNNVVGFRPTVRVVPQVGPGANAWLTISTRGPMGRTVDDVALLLGVLAAPDDHDPLYRPIDLPDEITPPDRPLRVAWSPDLGVPVEATQLDVLAGARQAMVDLGWDVIDDEPALDLASDCFRVLRAWNIANGPTARFHDRMDEIKATIQDEIRRGSAVTAAEVATAFGQLGALWRETVDFFDRGYDLLACPVTQVSPFPVDVEYPTEVAGVATSNYIDWMASCWRITVTGCPTLSLPAGFDVDGMPVGVQLVTRQGADVALLRAAKALEEATGLRRPAAAAGRDMTTPISDRVGIHGGRVAIVDPAGDWTFATIDDDAVHLAGALADRPRRPGGDPGHGRPRRRHRRPRLLARRSRRRAAAPTEPRRRAGVRRRRLRRGGDHRLARPIATPPTALPRRRGSRSSTSPPAGSSTATRPGLDRPALMIYTSGTTGRPKGAVHTHGSIAAMVDGMVAAWEWSAADRTVGVLPLNHVHGLVNVTLTPLAVGACCEAPGAFDAVARVGAAGVR